MIKREYKEIYNYCLASQETDSIKLVNRIMDFKKVSMHGPIHHFIVPAVLLTCYNNLTGGDKKTLSKQLKIAAARAKVVPGGNCANCGACGAALGYGQFASIITENSPLSTDSWSKVMEITSLCSLEISKHGGPRCCKRDVYLALITGSRELNKHFDINIKADKPLCKYFPKNQECLKQKCLFYPQKKIIDN